MRAPFHINSFETYQSSYKMSIEDPDYFWSSIADHFTWKKKWDEVVRWNFDEPKIEWFINGKLNITENILDRHLKDKGQHPAIIWEPNDPKEKVRKITYEQLYHDV